MTTLPSLELCTCGHPQGDHASTAGRSFNLHPIRHGRCQITGCDCDRFEEAATAAKRRRDK